MLAFASCMEDKGNYDYIVPKELVLDYSRYYTSLYAYEGDTLLLEGEFHYPYPDSTYLMENTTYEWTIGDVVICTDKDLYMPVDSILKKVNFEHFPSGATNGLYKITNSVTGQSYLHLYKYYFRPKFYKGSYLILSEDGANSKLSYLRHIVNYGEDGKYYTYEKYPDIFGEQNNGKIIPGKPQQIIDHVAKNISPSVGATTLITDQVAWEINNEYFKFHSDFKDEFSGGTPSNFKPVDIYHDQKYKSFIINQDGKVYVRTLSKNYLGGKFISEPYSIDGKDSKIEFYSNGQSYPYLRLLFDSNNNRIVTINSDRTISPIPKSDLITYDFDPTNLGENVEVLAMGNDIYSPEGSTSSKNEICAVLYKKDGEYLVGEFVLEAKYYTNLTTLYNRVIPFVGQLQPDSKIWFPCMSKTYLTTEQRYAIFYTSGNQIRYFNRDDRTDNLFMEFDHKITAVQFATYPTYLRYARLGVGFDNGDFVLINTDEDLDEPVIIEESRMNVGGKVVDISMVGGMNLD